MRHVFVETNWVVDYTAPVLARSPSARDLYARAQANEFVLHVPAIALVEARKVIRERRPREDVNGIRAFIRMARDDGRMTVETADSALVVLSQYEQFIKAEKKDAPTRIEALLDDPVVDVFSLDEMMLEESTLIAGSSALELQSFDLAILAAILVSARGLQSEKADLSFCTLDSDLQPWDRRGAPKEVLRDLYDGAKIWVYGDFLLETPARPEDWLASS